MALPPTLGGSAIVKKTDLFRRISIIFRISGDPGRFLGPAMPPGGPRSSERDSGRRRGDPEFAMPFSPLFGTLNVSSRCLH
jgi:hypothetical protein